MRQKSLKQKDPVKVSNRQKRRLKAAQRAAENAKPAPVLQPSPARLSREERIALKRAKKTEAAIQSWKAVLASQAEQTTRAREIAAKSAERRATPEYKRRLKLRSKNREERRLAWTKTKQALEIIQSVQL